MTQEDRERELGDLFKEFPSYTKAVLEIQRLIHLNEDIDAKIDKLYDTAFPERHACGCNCHTCQPGGPLWYPGL